MKNFKDLSITILYLFILNIVFSLLIYKDLTLSSVLFYLLESITFGSIINLISIPFKKEIRKIISTVIITFISILFIAQFVHFKFYDCFFSTYSLLNGGQVFGFMSAIINEIISNIGGFLILLGILIVGILLLIKKSIEIENKEKYSFILVSILIINLFITNALIFLPNNNNLYSRENLLKTTNSETKNVKCFGLISTMIIDLNRYLTSYEETIFSNNKTKYVFKDAEKTKYNIQNIDFDKINKETKNKNIQKLNNYFRNEEPTNKNKYTDILKGKNLIFITAESFSFSVIDKELTPTLYKMVNEGFNFTNFYTPIYYASTSDGEYTNLTGLLPKEGTWSYQSSVSKSFPYTYSNILKEKGYKTYAYHNGEYDFYDRNKIMPSFGYDSYKACGNGLEKKINCELWTQSDEEMFNKTFNDYKNDENFMVYYMSISTHLPHSFKSNDMAKKHQDKVKDLNYSEDVKAYISAAIDLDLGLEKLLKNLEKENLLDDTVIVLTPDHYPYGLSDKKLSELEKLENSYDKHKSGLIIYNSSIKPVTIDKYASNIDILPTLLNLFGVDYDSRLITGKDILSTSEGIVIFNDRSFLTDKGYYNEITNEFTNFTKEKVSNEYIETKRKEVFNKTNTSNLILETDYYKYIK